MATATIRPDGTIYGGGSISGGATTHGVLADGTSAGGADSSYFAKGNGSPADRVTMATTTKPAGTVLYTARPWARMSVTSGTAKASFWVSGLFGDFGHQTGITVTTTPTTYYGPAVQVGDLAQSWIDGLQMAFQNGGSSNLPRFIEAGIDFTFPAAPTVAVTAPTGTLTSSAFTIAWTHTPGADSPTGQTAYQIKVFNAAQFNGIGFDPDVTVPIYGWTTPGSAASDTGSLGAGIWRIYVRTAQSTGGTSQWSAWDYEQITVTLTTSEVSAVNAAAEPSDGSVEIVVDIDPATDTAAYVELERSVVRNEFVAAGLDCQFESGGGGNSDVTGVVDASIPDGFEFTLGGGALPASPTAAIQDTPAPWDGNYFLMGGTFDATERLLLDTGTTSFPVTPGDVVSIEAMIHSTLGTNCVGVMNIAWFDASATFMYSDEAAWASHSAWRPYWYESTVPSGARFAKGGVSIRGEAGASGAVCALAVDDFYMGVNPVWTPVRGAVDVAPVADQVTLFDHAAPPDTELRYRARAVNSTGALGDWDWIVGFVSWEMDGGVWVKSIADPGRNVKVRLAEPPSMTRDRDRGVFKILGAKYPVVVSDRVRNARVIDFTFLTRTDAEAVALEALCEDVDDVVAIHAPAATRLAPGYWSLGELVEVDLVRFRAGFPYRRWRVTGTEVAAPA